VQRCDRVAETRERWSAALLLTVIFLLPLAAASQTPAHSQPPAVEIISNAGWPELRVDGKPFFVHAASFDYFRTPADLWPSCLDRYRDLGINTIALRIPWNWHEPVAGNHDFSGATNPRRDLRGLLHLIADRGFKLIVRTGPAIGDDWRSGGFPDWLLTDSQFGMTASQISDGDEPRLEKNFREDADAAAVEWLTRANYLGAVREWFAALGAELAPYDSRAKYVSAIPVEADRQGKNNADRPKEENKSGPLLFFILEDSPSLLADASSSNLQQYLASLREALLASGVSAPILIEPADLEISGASPLSAWLGDSTPEHVEGVSGGWFPIVQRREAEGPGRPDAESIAMLLGTLSEQPSVPPLITNFQANSIVAGENDLAVRTSPSSVLLDSRMLLAGGARGLTYSQLQDSITPAGYETPGTSRYVNRDSPLDIAGETHPGAVEVGRNGKLVAGWGEWLAGAHVRADFGILDLRAAVTGPGWKVARMRATKIVERVIRTSELAGWTPELVDPAQQSVDQLTRDPALLFVVPDGDEVTLELTKAAQKTLIEYVEGGGTLIFAPRLPPGSGLAQLWNGPGIPVAGQNGLRASRHAYGRGAVIEWDEGFFSSAPPQDSSETQGVQGAAEQAAQDLASVLGDAGAKATEKPSDKTPLANQLLFSELVADSPAAGPATPAGVCNTRPLCAAALVSLTNLDSLAPANADLSVLAPALFPQTEIGGSVVIHATVPARDSLLLPVRASLCTTPDTPGDCQDELVYAGAELLGAEAEDKTLELTFYAPVNATVLLRLESRPEKIEIDENEIEGSWADGIHLLTVTLLRGAAPGYLRVLKIHLHYKPRVTEKPNAPKQRHLNYESSVVNAVRLPLGRGASMLTSPALLLLQNEKEDMVVLRTINHGDSAIDLTARVDGPERGSDYVRAGPGATDLTRIKLEATSSGSAGDEPGPTGAAGHELAASTAGAGDVDHALTRGQVTLRSGGEHTVIPLAFADLRSNEPLHYQYDFERDGAPDWTLESDELRLVLCPRDGGRAVAIVSKVSGENLTTVTGALRDWFLLAGADQPEDFTFNRSYDAGWIGSVGKPGLRMKYHAAEAGPAGATIEKTITLVSPDTFEVKYRVTLDSATGAPPIAGMQFIAASRVPATQAEADGTKLCWHGIVAPQVTPGTDQTGETCVDFPSNGGSDAGLDRSPRTLPTGVTHLEIRTPGSAGLRVEWSAGEMSLHMESEGVLLQLALPLGSGTPAEAVMRYTVFSAP
jgi:hypothetical protein